MTVYVRKSEESIYKALVLNSLTVQNFKTQVSSLTGYSKACVCCSLCVLTVCVCAGSQEV